MREPCRNIPKPEPLRSSQVRSPKCWPVFLWIICKGHPVSQVPRSLEELGIFLQGDSRCSPGLGSKFMARLERFLRLILPEHNQLFLASRWFLVIVELWTGPVFCKVYLRLKGSVWREILPAQDRGISSGLKYQGPWSLLEVSQAVSKVSYSHGAYRPGRSRQCGLEGRPVLLPCRKILRIALRVYFWSSTQTPSQEELQSLGGVLENCLLFYNICALKCTSSFITLLLWIKSSRYLHSSERRLGSCDSWRRGRGWDLPPRMYSIYNSSEVLKETCRAPR